MATLGGLNTLNDIFISGAEDAYFDSLTVGSITVTDVSLNGPISIPAINTIDDTTGTGFTVSLLNKGQSTFIGETHYANNLVLGTQLTFSTTYPTILNVLGTTNITQAQIAFLANVVSGQIGQTQIANGYVDLTTTQTITPSKTWTGIQQYTGYVIPRHSTTNSLRLGSQALQYQSTTPTDSYNICFGANTLRGSSTTPAYNILKRNIAIGDSVGAALTDQGVGLDSNDNVLIGHQALKSATYASGRNVIIGGGNIASGEYYRNNCLIGYGISSGTGQVNIQDSVVIGGGTAPTLSGIGKATVVGVNNVLVKNSFSVFGSDNLRFASIGNRVTILGSDNLNNIAADAFSCAVGASNGSNQAGGFYNCYIGAFNNIATSGIIGSATIGVNSTIPRDSCFYIGSNTNLVPSGLNTYQDLCIANKNTVLCTTETAAATYSINWEDGETINITANTTTAINLPTPNTAGNGRYNIGTRFCILKSFSPLTAITINAPSGQTIRLQDGSTTAAYVSPATDNALTIICIANSGTSYEIVCTSASNTNYVTTNTAQTITGQKTFQQSSAAASAIFQNTTNPVLITNNSTVGATLGASICINRAFGLNDFGSSSEYANDIISTPTIIFGSERGKREIYVKYLGNMQLQQSMTGNAVEFGQVITATQGFLKQAYRIALTANINFNTAQYYGATINIISATGNYIIGIPNTTGFSGLYAYGQTMQFNNNTGNTVSLLSGGGNFGGIYGTGSTTWVIAPYQNIEAYSDGNEWIVQRISGNPPAYMQTKNANQSIPNVTITSVPFQTNSNISWNNTATQLTYALVGTDYRFTNSTGYGMTVCVTANVGWATNATGIRMVQLIHSNTTRYGQSPLISQVPGNGTIGTTNFITGTFYMAPTEYFSIAAWQNSGAALNITITSPNTNITITRIS